MKKISAGCNKSDPILLKTKCYINVQKLKLTLSKVYLKS